MGVLCARVCTCMHVEGPGAQALVYGCCWLRCPKQVGQLKLLLPPLKQEDSCPLKGWLYKLRGWGRHLLLHYLYKGTGLGQDSCGWSPRWDVNPVGLSPTSTGPRSRSLCCETGEARGALPLNLWGGICTADPLSGLHSGCGDAAPGPPAQAFLHSTSTGCAQGPGRE